MSNLDITTLKEKLKNIPTPRPRTIDWCDEYPTSYGDATMRHSAPRQQSKVISKHVADHNASLVSHLPKQIDKVISSVLDGSNILKSVDIKVSTCKNGIKTTITFDSKQLTNV